MNLQIRLAKLEQILTSRDSIREQYAGAGEQFVAKLQDLARSHDLGMADGTPVEPDSAASWVAVLLYSEQWPEDIAERFDQAVSSGQHGACYAYEVLSAAYEQWEGNRT